MQNGQITDQQLSASSVHPAPAWGTASGRLNGPHAWHPYSSRVGKWFQVDLLEPTKVTGLVTHSRIDTDEWTKTYKILYGNHIGGLVPISTENGGDMVGIAV